MELFQEDFNISKKAHFIYFYNKKSKRSTEWDLMRYIAVKSFYDKNPSFTVTFYTNEQPVGEYWERASKFCKLKIVKPETEIYGNPLIHPAHISDVYRIKLLLEEGGVYSDFDTITTKSFEPFLKRNKFIIANQKDKVIEGCNAVMASPPNSPYMKAWLELYKEFRSKGRDQYWDETSVKSHSGLMSRPELAGTFELLTKDYFYPYSMYNPKPLYEVLDLKKITEKTFSIHLFDTFNGKHINSYTEEDILKNPDACTYTHLVNRYL